MTEQDLSLKATSRRLLWAMGFSTRVDVPLRAFVPVKAGTRSASHEEFTDLDVLGVLVGPDFRVQTAIVDCKTSKARSTERMFWVRGVSDFFSADDAYMVRSDSVTAAARQLAARLRIAVVTESDLAILETHYPGGTGLDEHTSDFLFNPDAIANHRRMLTGIDKKLSGLRDYQQYDYWVIDEYRNLQQLVGHLVDVAKTLDPQQRVHWALFFDSAWLYALSLARAAHHIRRTHVADVDTSLRQYLFGGELGLREKRRLAKDFQALTGRSGSAIDDEVLGPYYSRLLELTTRILRRPSLATTVLRYAEWLREALPIKEERPLVEVFGNRYENIAAKLLADVCGFLVGVAGLDEEFRTNSRKWLAPVNGEVESSDHLVSTKDTRTGPSTSVSEEPSRLPLNGPDGPDSRF